MHFDRPIQRELSNVLERKRNASVSEVRSALYSYRAVAAADLQKKHEGAEVVAPAAIVVRVRPCSKKAQQDVQPKRNPEHNIHYLNHHIALPELQTSIPDKLNSIQ